MVYKALIFDLDGTLVTSRPEYRYLIVDQTAKACGGTTTKEDIDRFWFETERSKVISESFRVTPTIFWEEWDKNHLVSPLLKHHTLVYVDTDLIEELRAKGIKTGIVTGAPPHIATYEISLIGEGLFDSVVIANSRFGTKAKPDPEGIEKCLAELAVEPQEALFIGNGLEDIEASRNANVVSVLIDRGEYHFEKIEPEPDYQITCLPELVHILDLPP